jgi:hypothetical protein
VVVSDQDGAHFVSVVGPTAAKVATAGEVQTGVRPLPCETTLMAGSWADDSLGGGLIILLSVVWAVCAIARAVVRDDD